MFSNLIERLIRPPVKGHAEETSLFDTASPAGIRVGETKIMGDTWKQWDGSRWFKLGPCAQLRAFWG